MEVWKDVTAGKNTNKNKLIIKKPAYIQLSNVYSSLPQFTDPLPNKNSEIKKDTNNDASAPIAKMNKST